MMDNRLSPAGRRSRRFPLSLGENLPEAGNVVGKKGLLGG